MPIVNLAEMARLLNVSLPTMREYLRRWPGLPVIQRGDQGQQWQLDADAVIAFLAERKAEEERAEEARRAAVAQLSLPEELLKPEVTRNGAALDADDYKTMRAADQLAKDRGFLVQTVEMRRALNIIWLPLNQALQSLPDLIAKKINLPSPVTRWLRGLIHGWQKDLHARLIELLGEGALPPPAAPGELDDAA